MQDSRYLELGHVNTYGLERFDPILSKWNMLMKLMKSESLSCLTVMTWFDLFLKKELGQYKDKYGRTENTEENKTVKKNTNIL